MNSKHGSFASVGTLGRLQFLQEEDELLLSSSCTCQPEDILPKGGSLYQFRVPGLYPRPSHPELYTCLSRSMFDPEGQQRPAEPECCSSTGPPLVRPLRHLWLRQGSESPRRP